MKSSYIIAAVVALSVTVWIVSGQIGETRSTEGVTAMPSQAQAEEVLPRVRVRELVAQERVNELKLFGRTEAERTVDLMAETSGRVASIEVEKGDWVKKGDVIVRIALDDRPYRLAEAEALVEQRSIAYQAAQALSEKAYRSKVNLAGSKAELEAAKAALERIRVDIERCTIRAPFDGVLDRRRAEVGYFVDVGNIVARVIDLDPILVVGEVSERHVRDVQVGSLAIVRLITGEEVGGTVRYVSKVASQVTRTFRVEVEVDNPKGKISEGLTTELGLPLKRVMAHRISPAVLTLSDQGVIGVKAVGEEDMVEFHPIKVIADTPEGVWLAGLPDRIRLITVGQEYVKTGQRVQPVLESEISGEAS